MTDGDDPTRRFVDVRESDAAEVAAMANWFGQRWALSRIKEAEGPAGSTYLVAWEANRPVGHANVRWDGSMEPTWQEHIRSPEINGLAVSSEGRGIGTALIGAAEALALAEGYGSIGIGVTVGNARAKTLYERLGYVTWEGGVIDSMGPDLGDDGQVVMIQERLLYMTKLLK